MAAARIMIVEDDTVVAAEVAQRLEALGYEIAAVAHAGGDALAMAAERRPDVVLLSLAQHGDTDGAQTARRVLGLGVPVVGLVGSVELPPPHDLPPLAGFVSKSAQGEFLRATVEQALRLHDIARALTAASDRHRQAAAAHDAIERLAHLGSWSQDPTSGELIISRECLHLHGHDPDTTCASLPALWARVDRGDRERLQELVQRAHREGLPYVIQYRLSAADGDERIVQNSAAMFTGVHGGRRLIASVQDITEHRRAEEALRQSEARASRLLQERDFILENSRDVLYYLDKNGLLFYISPVVEQLTGYSPEQWKGDFRRHLVDSPRTRKAIKETFEILRTGREYPPAILEFRKKDGGVLHAEISERPIIKDGEVQGLVGVARDVTERLQVEARLRQAAAVFENTQEAIMITDADRRISAVNHAFVEITGYAEAEVIGVDADFLAAQDEPAGLRPRIWSVLGETGRWSGEAWSRRKSGEAFPTWVTMSTIRDHERNVTHYVIVMSDLSRLKESEEKRDWLAHYDPLTRLPNRLLFNSLLAHAIRRAERERTLLAVMFIDLDDFKGINDTRGHRAGDLLLRQVGDRLHSCLRKEDTVARLSGDEFIVILEDIADSRFLADVAHKLLAGVSAPYVIDGEEASITASIGISLFPQDGRDPTQLVHNADAAMYRAKARGRGLFRFYTPALTRHAIERMAIEAALRTAVEREQFVLHYQPRISLDSGAVVGVEALIRWQHPERGLILPDSFIALGEDTGLIIAIGQWVLRTACRQVQAWIAAGVAPITLSVNISARQLAMGRALVDECAAILTETRFPPALLQLEIAEAALMRHGEEADEVMRGLKALGVSIAIDHFGTGYSSLQGLRRLSVDALKTDRSFVRDIARDTDHRAITEAIIGLGHGLRAKIIAEGVESPEQRQFLHERGCDEMQGFLFSPPLPEPECLRLLTRPQ